MATLSLFPAASVKKERSRALQYVSRTVMEPEFEMVKMSDDARGIIVAIEERPAPSSPSKISGMRSGIESEAAQPAVPSVTLSIPPKVRVAKQLDTSASRARTPSPVLTQGHVQVRSRSKSISPTAVKAPQSPHIQAPSPLQFEGLANDHASSPQLLCKGSNASFKTTTHSPVMRSMFPRYNANVPLGQQQYRPGAALSHQGQQSSKPILPILDIPATPAAAAPILQQTLSGLEAPKTSSSEDLLDVWSIANGQAAEGTVELFNIELICKSLTRDQEVITFSSASQALYTLSSRPNEISVSRTHPSNPDLTIGVCETRLLTPTATAPILAPIFPKLSELMALDQSSTIAVSHGLDRQASEDLQAEAFARARHNEESSLLWDSDSDRYFLIHPTLLDNNSTRFPIEITPSASSPERVVIYAPESDSATPVLEMLLSTRNLTIHTTPIVALPSLYTLDTLMIALLTLVLHLHRSSSISSFAQPHNDFQPPSFPPPPSALSASSRTAHQKKRTFSIWTKSIFAASTTQLPHDEERGLTHAENNNVVPSQTKALESEWGFKPMIDPEDEKLPKATRSALRGLYWGFEVTLWILSLLVNLLAAGIVGAGKVIRKL